MSAIGEKHSVWFDRRERRGVVIRVIGDTVTLLGSDLQTYARPLVDVEPLDNDICFLCGKHEPMTPEQLAETEARTKRDWGAVPPPERWMALCDVCADKMYKADRERLGKSNICSCSASRGESLRCVCEWRRAHGGPRK